MARLLAVSVLFLLLGGCVVVDLGGHKRESRSSYADVGVTEKTVDVSVRPGYKDGNIDVHVAWP